LKFLRGAEMYMVVFVALMVSIIGAFGQIYTKQAASGGGAQPASGVADAMTTWHTNAVWLATKVAMQSKIPAMTGTGCSLLDPGVGAPQSLTDGFPNGASAAARIPGVPNQSNLPYCVYWPPCLCYNTPVFVGTQPLSDPLDPSTADVKCSADLSPADRPCITLLPKGYSVTTYSFYSVAYNDGQAVPHYFVLTYVPPPPQKSDSYDLGLLCLPGDATGELATKNLGCPSPHVQVSTTFKSLYEQLRRNTRLSPMSYGTITVAGEMTTPTLPATNNGSPAPIKYIVPTAVPVGSIAMISEVPPCLTCEATP
jgi:hypothetical protein